MFNIWVLGIISSMLLCINKKKNNRYNLISIAEIIPIVCAFLLLTSNRIGFDIVNYNRSYISGYTITVNEPIYHFLANWFSKNGWTYYSFRAILSLIVMIPLILTIKRLEIKLGYFMIYYFTYFVFVDSMQVRNQIGLYLIVVASFFLVREKNKANVIKFCIIVIIAAQIHFIFYFYLLMLLYDNKYLGNVTKYGIIISIVLSIATLLNGHKVPFIQNIMDLLLVAGDDRSNRYIGSAGWGFLFPTIILILMLYISNYYCNVAKANPQILNNTSENYLLATKGLIQVSFIIIPFLMMNINYYRIIRNAYVIFVVSSLLFWNKTKKKLKLRNDLFVCVIIIHCMWCWFDLLYYNVSDNITIIQTVLDYGMPFWK